MRPALLLMVVCLLPLTVLAEEEKLTITTYYPSPIGVYQDLQTARLAVGDVNRNGSLDESDLPASQDDLNVAGNVTVNNGVTIGSGASSAVRLTVNGQIRVCDRNGNCGPLQVDCAGGSCYAVYSD
jgi:hypothetical protein